VLDRLPAEILDEILLLAGTVPLRKQLVHGPLWTTEKREKTLSSACLVSKGVCARAQALLWKQLILRGASSQTRFNRLKAVLRTERGTALAKSVRRVHALNINIEFLNEFLRKTTDVQDLHLERLRTSYAPPVDWSILPTLSSAYLLPFLVSLIELTAFLLAELTSLALIDVELHSSSTPFLLSSLSSLTIARSSSSAARPAPLLDAQNSPSLRALSLDPHHDRQENPSIPSALLDNLEVVQHYRPSPPLPHNIPTLFTFDPYHPTSTSSSAHLRYLPEYTHILSLLNHSPGSVEHDLKTLLACVHSSSSSPRSLSLPSFLHTSDPMGALRDLPSTRRRVGQLLAACEEGNVEVIWHEDDWRSPHTVSPSFRHYAKELKRKETVEA
jgi:hypothetical protein